MRQPSELTDEDAIRLIFNQLMLGMRTNIPAIVDSEAPYKNGKFWCVTAIPAINFVDSTTGKAVTSTMKPRAGVPIFTPCGGGFAHTVPIKKGDSVWLSVSDRGIDNWQLEANTQDAPELASIRHHDLTDCVAIVGGLSMNQLDSYYNDGVSIQNKAGTTFAHVNNESIELVESGGASITMQGGSINIIGNIIQQGSFENDTSVKSPVGNFLNSLLAALKEIVGHNHGGVASGSNNTGPNN